MNRTIQYSVTTPGAPIRVSQFLRHKGFSARHLARLKRTADSVWVNGQSVFLNYPVQTGDLLTLRIQENETSENIRPVPLPLDILFEDEDLLVVNKSAGMPIHPSFDNRDNSLANALAWYFSQQNKSFVFRCCNRLDRDTSGLTVIAKHSFAASILSEMGQRREIHREYLAIVRGTPTPAFGTICAPLGRKPGSIIERVVDFECGEPAVTHYKLIGHTKMHSLVSLCLETGRTHQIRIHMKYLGFPLIGDYLYNPDMEHIQRQALHSHTLAFQHPITREKLSFTAPLPADMQAVLDL